MQQDVSQIKLIQLFNAGDKASFESIFNQYFQRLCAFSYRYLKSTTTAEDLVQEVFISLWEKRARFDHVQAVKAFLYTATRNKCLNHLKHQDVLRKHEPILIRELESEHFFTNHVIEEEVFGNLYTEISLLPEASQKIMVLVLKGLKNREIADELQISENTVKTQKKIAYAKLKKNLNPVFQAILLCF